MIPRKWRTLALAALTGTVLGGCAEDDATPLELEGPAALQQLFSRYVALGNSITAGFQSAGISDSTQMLSYPNLIAEQVGAPFQLPLFEDPGCPPPWIAPLGVRGRIGGPTAPECSLRQTVTRPIQNLAVPAAQIGDAVDPFRSTDPRSSFNRLQTIILGGRSMLTAAQQLNPTLVSVWLGNGDVLGAALSGNAAALTSEAAFNAAFSTLADGLEAIPALEEVVIYGVVNTNVIPLLQPGAYFWLSATPDPLGGFPRFQGKPVNPTCAPTGPTGQPNPDAFNLVSFEMVGAATFPQINCSETAYPVGDPRRGVFVLTQQEQAAITARTAAFNATLRQRADAEGWIFLDTNQRLQELGAERTSQGLYQNLRKCQELQSALQTRQPARIQAAIVTSCPVPPTGATAPFAAPNFFGALISFDGFHPSTLAHQHAANLAIQALNLKYGLSIPLVEIG